MMAKRKSKKKRRNNQQITSDRQVCVGGAMGQEATSGDGVTQIPSPPTSRRAVRPTAQRMAQGKWAEPQGALQSQQPMVDLASDMIGALYQGRKITNTQEQAARLFQELRAGYLAEIGTRGYRSCLADNQSGFDGGDGNVEVVQAYRSLEGRIGRVCVTALVLEVDKRPDQRPHDLGVLKNALNVVARG